MYEVPEVRDSQIRDGIYLAEIIITVLFAADYILWFFMAHNKVGYLLHWQSVLDLLSILPVPMNMVTGFDNSFSFLHVLQIFRLLRILKAFRLFKTSDWETDVAELNMNFREMLLRELAMFMFTLFCTIFIFAG